MINKFTRMHILDQFGRRSVAEWPEMGHALSRADNQKTSRALFFAQLLLTSSPPVLLSFVKKVRKWKKSSLSHTVSLLFPKKL